MQPNLDPDHYYNNPEKLAKRRNLVRNLRDYSIVGGLVFGGAYALSAVGVIEAPSQDFTDALRVAAGVFAFNAVVGELTQRSMGSRLDELQQPPEQPQ